MKVTAQYAAEHFDDLALAVDHGEVVEISRPEKPALKLVQSVGAGSLKLATPRVLGAGKALTHLPNPEELERIDREWKRELSEKTIGLPIK